jgi:hypothetical protein
MKRMRRVFWLHSSGQILARVVAVSTLAPSAGAQDYVLSIRELHQAAANATSPRLAEGGQVDTFLANDSVKKVVKNHKIDESPAAAPALALIGQLQPHDASQGGK